MKIKLSSALLALLSISLAASQSIVHNCKEVTLRNVQQIDAGAGQVIAVDRSRRVFHLHGSNWLYMNNYMQHASVGPTGIWGVDRQGYINKVVAGKWTRTSVNQMRQVDAGGDQFVVATGILDQQMVTAVLRGSAICVNRTSAVGFMTPGNSVSTFWITAGYLKYYSCGPNSCWAVNNKDEVFVTKRVDPRTCKGSNVLSKVAGTLSMVEVATDGSVYGVNSKGQILRRNGISIQRPKGTSWIKIDVCLPARHVSYDLGRLWVVTKTGIALECLI
ncbi:fish-egg lectin-like isoform X1 [Alosa sapidissima]|uniref:fish-egg lectin-like isoform X1 n=1 Tax=Alosa sapidissima TaxID=34773 RepID=UPI001C0835E0|nr:fish-egg lectin-like isoform X1 [Alosa sapidissima]